MTFHTLLQLTSDMTAIPSKKRVSVQTRNHNAGRKPPPRIGRAETEPVRNSHDALLEKAIQGSHEAFRELVLSHHRSVRVFLARYVHEPGQVDDLAQDVFIAAFKQLSRFRNESTFLTWILGIARNKALQFLRTELRRHQNRKKLFEAASSERSIDYLNHDSIAQDRIVALRACLELLPLKSQNLIHQFYFEKQTSAVIADQSNVKDSAIRMKLKRIRGVLQSCIASKITVNSERGSQS